MPATSLYGQTATQVWLREERRNQMLRQIMQAMDVMTANNIPEHPRHISLSASGMVLLMEAAKEHTERLRISLSSGSPRLFDHWIYPWNPPPLTYNQDGQAVLFPELESNEKPNRLHNLRRPQLAGRNANRGDRAHHIEQPQDGQHGADLHPAQGHAAVAGGVIGGRLRDLR